MAAAKIKQVGTVRFGGKAYGPKMTADLAKAMPKEDFERLQKNPRVFQKVKGDEEDEGVVSMAEQHDIDSMMDVAELRKLRRQAKGDEEFQARVDARITQLGGE